MIETQQSTGRNALRELFISIFSYKLIKQRARGCLISFLALGAKENAPRAVFALPSDAVDGNLAAKSVESLFLVHTAS
jgi:hypothetical protein